jgi:nicotinamidase/pyrazinamidase
MNTVFVDVDTQIDFMYPTGALYVPGAEKILPAVVRLNSLARSRGFPVISTADAHTENDPEFKKWASHCVAGTLGQRKPAATLLEPRRTIPSTPGSVDPAGAAQIILEKQALDCFTNPNLPALLQRLAADRYVVYGVVTEYCVRSAAMGLLKTGARVELVTDAIRELDTGDARRTLDEFVATGGVLTTAEQLLS